jgi:hypothetical protein
MMGGGKRKEGRKEGRGGLRICCFSAIRGEAILNFVAFKGCNFF